MMANYDVQRINQQQLTKSIFTSEYNRAEGVFDEFREQMLENRRQQRPWHEGLPAWARQLADCLFVAKGLQLGEQAQLARSIVGRGVVIGKRTKITNCIILGSVRIGDE
jgi:serine acetyltransferase